VSALAFQHALESAPNLSNVNDGAAATLSHCGNVALRHIGAALLAAQRTGR
jgi:hypothetical protein